MVTRFEVELNPYEQAINLCKQRIKESTAAKRDDLAKLWTKELDKWNKAYHKFSSTVPN